MNLILVLRKNIVCLHVEVCVRPLTGKIGVGIEILIILGASTLEAKYIKSKSWCQLEYMNIRIGNISNGDVHIKEMTLVLTC